MSFDAFFSSNSPEFSGFVEPTVDDTTTSASH
jgi:hypothetical protein